MEIETLKFDPFVIPPLGALAELHTAPRERVDLDEINIPDLWHIVDYRKKGNEPRAALAVYQAWIIALDLLNALRHVESKQR